MTPSDSPGDADNDALVLDFELEAAPDRVWRTVSEPDLAALWLAPETAPGGPIDFELIQAEPGQSVRYAWRSAEPGGPLDSEVTFELHPGANGGVRLRVIHGGLSAAAKVISLADRRRARASAASASQALMRWAA